MYCLLKENRSSHIPNFLSLDRSRGVATLAPISCIRHWIYPSYTTLITNKDIIIIIIAYLLKLLANGFQLQFLAVFQCKSMFLLVNTYDPTPSLSLTHPMWEVNSSVVPTIIRMSVSARDRVIYKTNRELQRSDRPCRDVRHCTSLKCLKGIQVSAAYTIRVCVFMYSFLPLSPVFV